MPYIKSNISTVLMLLVRCQKEQGNQDDNSILNKKKASYRRSVSPDLSFARKLVWIHSSDLIVIR